MLTKGDEYPLHQRPEPVATAGTDRNFYDRFFFNGYSADGSVFFAAALGVYPHLGVMDAAFSVNMDNVQRSVFSSRIITDGERLDTDVAPIAVDIVEPLKSLRLAVAAHDGPLAADMIMTGRAPPIEEPRFTHRIGTRTLLDVTRMTQAAQWQGWLSVEGQRHEIAGWWGTRDRSWGVRPIGASDPQPPADPAGFQFYWLWSPLNFERHALFFHSNDDAAGHGWNRAARLVSLDDGSIREVSLTPELSYKPGTRNARTARLSGDGITVDFDLERNFHMHGIGYGHPSRAHGTLHGPHSVHQEAHRLDELNLGVPQQNHVQALAAVTMTLPDGSTQRGRGVLEQMFIGPHAPSGFSAMFDLA